MQASLRFRPERTPTPDRLPVTIITGFLGSGKTTLLNHILVHQKDLKVAVLVNELGAIGIDRELIVSVEGGLVELSNGCICCSINNDLVDAIARVLKRPELVDYLIVETTGVADPLPIVLTFLRSEFRGAVRLDSILTLVDAENFSLDLFDIKAAQNQLLYGDVILLNKCDLVDSPRLDALEARIRTLTQGARIVRTTRAQIALPMILSVGLFQSDRYVSDHIAHDHGTARGRHGLFATDEFVAVSFESDRPLSVDRFQHFLNTRLPPDVFRGKGVLWMAENDQTYVFHLVGKRFTLDADDRAGVRRNRLVLIGRNLNGEQLCHELERCLVRERPQPAVLHGSGMRAQ
jgi:G3E family GTPase